MEKAEKGKCICVYILEYLLYFATVERLDSCPDALGQWQLCCLVDHK